MATIAEAFVKITPTTTGMQGDISRALQGLNKVGDKAGKDLSAGISSSLSKGIKGKGKAAGDTLGKELTSSVNKSLSGFKIGAVAGVFSTVTQAALGSFDQIVSGAIEASDATDKFKATLDFAGLDTAAIDAVTKRVQDYADKTVYSLGDIQNMTAQLASNGVKDYVALGEAAGNLNAIAGGNAETFKSVGMVMTQTAGAGKLTTENWNQLSDAIPGASGKVQQALLDAGAYTGNFRDAMAQGQITAEEFNAAVMELGSEPIAVEAAQSTETFEGMLGNLQATIQGGLAEAFTELKPIIGSVFDGISAAVSTALPVLVSGVTGAADAMKAFGGWVKDNQSWVKPLAISLGTLGAAYLATSKAFDAIDTVKAAGGLMEMFKNTKLVTVATRSWAAVTKGAAAVQAALNAVMVANPIGLIVAAIAAVVAALVLFFTKTEWGREIWQGFMDFLKNAWEAIPGIAQATWGWLTDFFSGLWDGIVAAAQTAWTWFTNLLTTVWQGIVLVATTIWNGLVVFFSMLWEGIVTAATTWWTNFKANIQLVWNTIIAVGQAIWTGLANFFSILWQGIQTVATTVWNRIKSTVVNAATGLRDGVKSAVENLKQAIQNFVHTAKAKFDEFVNKVSQIPGNIKSAFSGAASWLVDAGANIIRGLANGVRSMAGAIADAVRAVVPDNLERFVPGLHFGGVIPAFARGGVLPRVPGISDSERDPILGLNGKGIPIARVEPGEFIVNREATKKHLPLLRAINGGRVNGKQGDLGLPAYKDGGVVSAKQFLEFARGMNVGGKKAPRSLEGAPYVWGGGLLGNWGDCSGAMSGLAAFAVGMALAGRKFATMNEGQVLSQMGFSRGTSSGKNAFEVGFFNGGNFGGHTSGTLYDANGKATHLEMGGGRGNGQIGGAAAGARHSQYTDRYFINLRGGQADDITSGDVVSTSSDGVTIKGESGTTYQIDWGEANSLASAWDSQSQRGKKLAAWERAFGSFDQGGLLSGKGVFAKNTLSPERVLSPSQTAAFEKLPAALVKQARAIDGLTARLEWQKVGAEIGEGLAAKGAFGAAMLGDIAKGDSLRAYASSMSLADGVGLADRVGKLLGVEKIGSTLNPVVGAWTDMEDAAIGQVDAADAVKQAEKNLADARAKGDAQAIESAETELSKATGVAKMAAAAVGQAQVAMALTVVETIIGLVDLVIGRISAVGEAQGKAWAGIEDAFASMGKLASTIADLRHDVNALSVDWAMSMIELSNAYRDLRIVQQDGIVAQLEGAVEVAELQAEFEAQRKADMRAAVAHYDDLSLAYDAFRWAMAGANQQAMDEMAAWSDESHRIYSELLAAQVGQKILEKQALLDNLEATWKLAQASFNLNDVTADLSVAAQKLAVASGAAFGVSEGEATVGERYATLVAEMAELKATNAKFGTWINPTNWGKNGLMGQNNRRIEQIEAELARIESMDEFKSLDSSVKTQVDDLVSRAGWMGFFGSGDKVSQLVSNSALGDAARALDQMDFETRLIDIQASQTERERDIQKGLAEVEYLRQSSPLEAQIKALESEQASYETMAKYWETSNEDVRAALLRLAEAQEQGAKVVQITGSTVSTDDLAVALEQLGIRVEKIENPKPDAAAVVAGRR